MPESKEQQNTNKQKVSVKLPSIEGRSSKNKKGPQDDNKKAETKKVSRKIQLPPLPATTGTDEAQTENKPVPVRTTRANNLQNRAEKRLLQMLGEQQSLDDLYKESTGDKEKDSFVSESRLQALHQLAVVERQPERQIQTLTDLGDMYLRKASEVKNRKHLIEAASLYNAALVRCQTTEQKRPLASRLRDVELGILGYIDKKKPKDSHITLPRRKPMDSARKHKEALHGLRDFTSDQALRTQLQWAAMLGNDGKATIRKDEMEFKKECQILKKAVKHDLRSILVDMVRECIIALGELPCPYAILMLGDLAAEECTPYSDVELLILVDDDAAKTIEYFNRLALYLQFKILNLGETPLSATNARLMNDIYFPEIKSTPDFLITNGIKICTHSMIASMQKHCYINYLDNDNHSAIPIRRPQDLVKSFTNMHLEDAAEYIFQITQASVLYGESDLLQQTKHSLSVEYFQKPERRLQLFSVIIEARLKHFKLDNGFDFHKFEMDMHTLQKELVLTNMLIRALHVLYSLQSVMPGKILEELNSRLILSDVGEHDLKMASSIAHLLYCVLHCYYKGQNTATQLLASTEDKPENIGFDSLKDFFGYRGTTMLIRLYSTVLPLVNYFKKTIKANLVPKKLDIEFLQYNLNGKVFAFQRTLQDKQCLCVLEEKEIKLIEQEATNAMKLFETYTHLGLHMLNTQNIKGARMYLTKAMDLKEKIDNQDKRVLCFVRTWYHMGLVYVMENDIRKGENYFKEALTLYSEMTEGDIADTTNEDVLAFHITVHNTLHIVNKWTANYTDSLNNLQMALHYHEKLGTQLSPLKLHLLQNSGQISMLLSDYKGAHYYFKKALQECHKYYGPHTPSAVRASIFNNLAQSAKTLGKTMVSEVYATAAMDEFGICIGKPDAITTSNIIKSAHGRMYSSICSVFTDFSQMCHSSEQWTLELSTLNKVLHLKSEMVNKKQFRLYIEEVYLLWNKALCLYQQKRYIEAKECAGNSADIFKHVMKRPSRRNLFLLTCERLQAMTSCGEGDASKATSLLRPVLSDVKLDDDFRDMDQLYYQCVEDQAIIYESKNEYDNALTIWQTILEQRKQLHGSFHPLVAETHKGMGTLHKIMCDFDRAIAEFNKGLHVYDKIYGDQIPSRKAAELCLELGVTYQEAGRVSHAQTALLKAMKLWTEINHAFCNLESINTCLSLGNLFHKMSKLKLAVKWHKRALHTSLSIKMIDRPHEVQEMLSSNLPAMIINLASDYFHEDLFADAIQYYEMAMDIHRLKTPADEDTLQIAQWWVDLSKAHNGLGHAERSEDCQQNAIIIRQRILGEEKEEVEKPSSLSVLAEHFEHRGQYKKSLPLRKKALSQAKLLHGNEAHPDVIVGYKMLIDVYMNIGYYEQAQRKTKELMTLFKRRYGEKVDHSEIAGCHRLAGLISHGLSQFDKSSLNFDESVAIYERLGISKNANALVKSLTEYARCLLSIGQKQRAEVHLKRAKEICQPEGTICLADIEAEVYKVTAWSYECHPNFSKAINMYTKSLKLYRSHYGKGVKNLKIALCLCGLGRSQCVMKQFHKGIKNLTESVAILSELYGDGPLSRKEVMDAHIDLANAHFQGGDPKISFNLFTKILLMAKQKFGTDRPNLQIAKYLGFVAHAARKAQEYDSAINAATEAVDIYNKVLKKKHCNHPDRAAIITLLGDVYLEINQADTALRQYKDAAHIHLILHNGNALSKEVEAAMMKVRSARTAIEKNQELPKDTNEGIPTDTRQSVMST